MADQGRWFKLWTTAPSDPDLSNLSLEDFARWCIFGTYLEVHGDRGTVTLRPPCTALVNLFRVPDFDTLICAIMRFPNCVIRHDENTVTVSVTWRNWNKYQVDTTAAERQKRRRLSRSKKRGEETRREESPPNPPAPTLRAVERPPATPAPDYVTSCRDCAAMLRTLNESSGRFYNAPGRAGEWMHLAHDGRPMPEVIATITRQVRKLIRLPGKARFLSPSVLFKPENWDTTVNDRPAPADDPDDLMTPPEQTR